MTGDAWTGRRVKLRAIEPADAETLFESGVDTEDSRAGGGTVPVPLSLESVREWARKESVRPPAEHDRTFVICSHNGELVGTINVHHANPRVGAFSYGVGVERAHRKKGYASEAIVLLIRHYFEELRYQKVTVTVYDFNEASLAMHLALGFQHEGRMRRTVYTAGRRHDEIVLGMTKEEFAERHPESSG